MYGEAHGTNGLPSREHLKVEFASLLVRVSDPVGEFVSGGGAPVTVSVGAVRSSAHAWLAGADLFPSTSVAQALKVWDPVGSPPYDGSLVQDVTGPASS